MTQSARSPFTRPSPSTSRGSRMRARRVLAGLAIAAAAIAACSSGISEPGAGLPVIGTYHLVAVNNVPLPSATDSGIFVRGSLTFDPNLHFSITETDSAAGATSTFTANGTWSMAGFSLTLRKPDASAFYGTATTMFDTIRIDLNGHSSRYAR